MGEPHTSLSRYASQGMPPCYVLQTSVSHLNLLYISVHTYHMHRSFGADDNEKSFGADDNEKRKTQTHIDALFWPIPFSNNIIASCFAWTPIAVAVLLDKQAASDLKVTCCTQV